jgi:hypothetical protein
MTQAIAGTISGAGTFVTANRTGAAVTAFGDRRVATFVTRAIGVINAGAIGALGTLATTTGHTIFRAGPPRSRVLTVFVGGALETGTGAATETVDAGRNSALYRGDDAHVIAGITLGTFLPSSAVNTAKVAASRRGVDQAIVGVITTFRGLISGILTSSAEGAAIIDHTFARTTAFARITIGVGEALVGRALARVADLRQRAITIVAATRNTGLIGGAKLAELAIGVDTATRERNALATTDIADALDLLPVRFQQRAILVGKTAGAYLTEVLRVAELVETTTAIVLATTAPSDRFAVHKFAALGVDRAAVFEFMKIPIVATAGEQGCADK